MDEKKDLIAKLIEDISKTHKPTTGFVGGIVKIHKPIIGISEQTIKQQEITPNIGKLGETIVEFTENNGTKHKITTSFKAGMASTVTTHKPMTGFMEGIVKIHKSETATKQEGTILNIGNLGKLAAEFMENNGTKHKTTTLFKEDITKIYESMPKLVEQIIKQRESMSNMDRRLGELAAEFTENTGTKHKTTTLFKEDITKIHEPIPKLVEDIIKICEPTTNLAEITKQKILSNENLLNVFKRLKDK